MPNFSDDDITAALHRFYDEDLRRLDELAAALHQAAVEGNVAAFNAIADRIDGPAPLAGERRPRARLLQSESAGQ